jgi:hypothetical protein
MSEPILERFVVVRQVRLHHEWIDTTTYMTPDAAEDALHGDRLNVDDSLVGNVLRLLYEEKEYRRREGVP